MKMKEFYHHVKKAKNKAFGNPEIVIYCPDAPRPVSKVRLHPGGESFIIETE